MSTKMLIVLGLVALWLWSRKPAAPPAPLGNQGGSRLGAAPVDPPEND